MPKPEIKPLFVRLTEAERRRIKTMAVSQGLTLRQAILQAFEAWASRLQSGALTAHPARRAAATTEAEKSRRSADANMKSRGQPREAATGRQVGFPAEVRPSEVGPSLGGGLVPSLEALTGDWPARAAQLDWSTCPAAEVVHTKKGNVWVASGTLGPLVDIFEAVAGGNPLPEIAEVYEITVQQLTALLQFALQSSAPPASGH